MTKRVLQHIVLASYTKEKLDEKKVNAISKLLSRADLKAYIRALQLLEQQKKINIAMPKASVYNTSKKDLQKIFAGKELVFTEDPSLLLGLQIVDNDMVYEMSLKNRLETILDQVSQEYND